MKHATNVYLVSGKNWKGFQGQRSKLKVIGTLLTGTCKCDISLVTDDSDETCHKYSSCQWEELKIFSRSGIVVKVNAIHLSHLSLSLRSISIRVPSSVRVQNM